MFDTARFATGSLVKSNPPGFFNVREERVIENSIKRQSPTSPTNISKEILGRIGSRKVAITE